MSNLVFDLQIYLEMFFQFMLYPFIALVVYRTILRIFYEL